MSVDQVSALLDTISTDELASLLRVCTPEERRLISQLVEAKSERGWRATPATMAHHLTDGRTKLWPYVTMLGEAFARLVSGESTRQIWMLPARYGKTDQGSRWGPVWALENYPWLSIILTSYGDSLASENSGAVRDLITQHGDQLKVRVRQDRSARDDWYTTEGGHVLAAGVGSTMTGYGGDVVVIDDPFKNWQEAHSATRRQHVWDWYRSVVRLRLQQDSSAILVVGTRWHEDDLAGRLLEPPDGEDPEAWEVIRLPALAEPDDPHASKWWERGPDPLGRAPGEPLEPARFSVDAVKTRARVLGTYLSAALEQQRPSAAEGGVLKRDWWQFYEAPPTGLTDWLISWDSSFKDADDSSYCVGQVWGRRGGDKFLLDQVRARMDYPSFRTAVTTLAGKWPEARVILVEDKANGSAVIADLKRKISGMIPVDPEGSKVSRAHAVSGDIEAGNVYLPDPSYTDDDRVDRSFVNDFMEEAANFPNAAHDDQVDAMSQALSRWDNTPPPRQVIGPRSIRQDSAWR